MEPPSNFLASNSDESRSNSVDSRSSNSNSALSSLSDSGLARGGPKKAVKCLYCGHSKPISLAKCLDCNQWFCNSLLPNSACHLIFHLLKQNHKAVQLHKNSVTRNDLLLECFFCNNRNIFVLGLSPYMGNSSQLIICCRKLYCASSDTIETHEMDPNQWTPVIKDRQIISQLLKPVEVPVGRPLKIETLETFEKEFAKNKEITIQEIESRQGVRRKAQRRVRLQWQNVREYVDCFSELLELELEESCKINDRLRFSKLRAWVERIDDRRTQILMEINMHDDLDMAMLLGQEIELNHDGEEFSGLVKRLEGEKIVVETDHKIKTFENPIVVDGKIAFKTASFDRMMQGLEVLGGNRLPMHQSIVQILLGNVYELRKSAIPGPDPRPADFLNIPGLPSLNDSQVEACVAAVSSRFSLLQGPPGTGKSITCASIVYYLARRSQRRDAKGQPERARILVCAPSNIVSDHLVGYIARTGLKVLQICSKLREAVEGPDASPASLHYAIASFVAANPQTPLARLYEQRQRAPLSDREHSKFRKLLGELEARLFREADVICSTCSGAFDSRLRHVNFPYVLIDEATQAVEPECLLPFLKGAQSVVLVGDHMQLGPVVSSTEAASRGLKQSLFERMIKLGAKPIRLTIQYRMHPELSTFSSDSFYEGLLKNGVSTQDRSNNKIPIAWPTKTPLFFWHTVGEEELSSSGTSYINKAEAVIIEKVLVEFLKKGVEISQLCVITSYKGQRAFIRMHLFRSKQIEAEKVARLEINSIDGFQGREKDFVLISTVRSSEKSGVGFLKDERRLNVALTRARFGMVVTGNAIALARSNIWNNYLAHLSSQGLIFEGSDLSSLNKSLLQFKHKENTEADKEHGAWMKEIADKERKLESMFDNTRVSQIGFTD